MRTVAHISDLHFGREDPAVVKGLREELRALQPSLIAVSGDLTQRARRKEFVAAAEFLASLGGPAVAVPGNHDIPLFDLVRRVFRPLARYRRFIDDDLTPLHSDEELAVLGLNTARPYLWKDGRISRGQIERIRQRLCVLEPSLFRILVTHHPFVPRPGDPHPAIVGGGIEALRVAEACGVDLLLAGHLHHGYLADVRATHRSIRRAILVAQAGTAVSHRIRHEPNAYNLITLDLPRLSFETRLWNGRAFVRRDLTVYTKQESEWKRE